VRSQAAAASHKGVRHGLVVDGFEEPLEADAVLVNLVMQIVLDGGDPSHRPAVPAREKVLRGGVLEKGILPRGEQRADVHPQLRYPQRVAAVVLVREGDEALEIAPAGDGRISTVLR